MILADCHTHSAFSSDSEESLENQVLAAVNKGLKTLCITEHFDPDYPDGEFASWDWWTGRSDFASIAE